MQKRILLFDIDRTILDTDGMIKDLDGVLLPILGYPDTESFKKIEKDYIKTLTNDRYFVPEDYIKMLCTRFNFDDQEKLLEVFYGEKYKYVYQDNVFPETYIVLNKLKNNFRLGIYSEGTVKFQNNKFKSMGLNEYFNKNLIFIVDAKDTKEVINKIPKSAIIVDDKEHICGFLTKNKRKAIWLNKTDNRVNPNFETIHGLLDLNLLYF